MTLVVAFALRLSAVHAYGARTTLTIVNDASLDGYLDTLATWFKKQHKDVDIHHEAVGSFDAIKQAGAPDSHCDLVFVSDARLLQVTNPGLDSWSISFAGNSLGLAYTAKSKGADQIAVDNWYKLLVEQHARYGRVDPDSDPLGYWTLISWVLAQNYYMQAKLARDLLLSCSKTNVKPKESDLLAMLQSGQLDYFFAYRSDAMNPNLRFLRLPQQISLEDPGLAHEYSTVTIGLGPQEHKRDVVGAPIAYAVTLPAQAPNRKTAVAFLQFMCGRAGRNIGVNSGLVLYNQPLAYKAGKEFPQALFKLVKFAP